jgi:hypothetical protein
MTCHCCARVCAVRYAFTLGLRPLVTKCYATHLGVMLLCRACWIDEERLRTWPGTPASFPHEETIP